MGGILSTLGIGLVAGALAKFAMPGKDPGGLFITIALGIAGSFVASFLGKMFGLYGAESGVGPGIIASAIGAFVLLAIYRVMKGRKGTVA